MRIRGASRSVKQQQLPAAPCVPKSRTQPSKHGMTESSCDNSSEVRTRLRPRRTSCSPSAAPGRTQAGRLQMVLNVEERAGRLGRGRPGVLSISSNQIACITPEVSEGSVSPPAPCKVFGPLQASAGPLERLSPFAGPSIRCTSLTSGSKTLGASPHFCSLIFQNSCRRP